MSLIENGTVLLLGSGISIFSPASGEPGLPTGDDIVRGVIDRLFGPVISEDFGALVRKTPFEQILDHHPDPARLPAVFSDCFDTKLFNPVHAAIAREVLRGRVEAIVTTNYDRCLEGALEAASVPFTPIVEMCETSFASTPVFKIHGSAERRHSIVATLSKEFCLPDWKYDLLKRLLNGRRLVMLGFSGLDFDVCPAIFSSEMRPRLRVWNEPFHESVNFQRAVGMRLAQPQKLLFDEALGDGTLRNPSRSDTKADFVVDAIFRDLSRAEVQAWRFDLLNALSLVRYMRDVITSCEADPCVPDTKLTIWKADVAEREGRYLTSIRLLKEARSSARKTGNAVETWTLSTTIAGRLYTARRTRPFLEALFGLSLRSLFGGKRQRADVAYLWGLACKGAYVSLKIGNRPPSWTKKAALAIASWIGCVFLRSAARHSYATGRWQALYLCQVQLQDLGGDPDLRSVGRGHFLNLATDGFRHLNNFVGEISAERKHDPEKFADVIYLTEKLEMLEHLGLYPEIWKLAEGTYSPRWAKNVEGARSAIEKGLYYVTHAEIDAKAKAAIVSRLNENLALLGLTSPDAGSGRLMHQPV